MSLITQIKTDLKTSAAKMATAKKRLAKADANTRAAAQALNAARDQVKAIEAEQTRLAGHLKLEEGNTSSPKAKPGPKPKAVKVKAAGHKKPGPKPKAVKAKKVKAVAKAKPAKAGKASRAAQGRREVASGARPPIKPLLVKVIGKRVMHAHEVYETIKAKGQLPNSGDPRGYIGYLLSASKTKVIRAGKEVEVPLFERVHEKGRGFYKNRGVSVAKAAKAPAKAAPKKAAAKPAKAKASAKPEKTSAKPEAKGAPMKDGKRTVTCKKCGETGHNSKGHDRAMAAKEPKAAKPVKEPKAAKPAKDEGPKADKPKRTVTCKKCGETGHNSKGHDRVMAAKATNGNGHSTKAEKPEPEAKPAKVETKDDSEKSTDEILAEAGIDAGTAL